MRGVKGTQESRLPVEHARAEKGGALCGARQKFGVILAQRYERTSCRKCRAKLLNTALEAEAKRQGEAPCAH